MSNEKISALSTQTNVRLIDGLAGYEGAVNKKISGPELVTSVINSNGSGAEGRIPFYGVGADNFGGTSGLTWDQTTDVLQLGTPGGGAGLNGVLNVRGNYIASNEQPEVIFTGGNSVAGSFEFKITTSTNGAAQTWILPEALPTAGQVLEANAVSTNDVTLSWVTAGAGGGSFPSAVTASSVNPTTASVDTLYTITTTGGVPDIEVTLPTAVANSGKIIGVKYAGQNSVNDTVVIKTISSQTIDGVNRTTNGLPLASLNTYYELISDGSQWFIK